ncbi:MAG: hypothetical protein OEW39_02135, partial [Deltaproteobacteria bacterium]|nr:hypothetical protein [Deltaproteobacteria bacterium]
MSIFPSLHHTPGTSPGSLIAYPESPKSTGRFHLIHYNASQFSEIKEVWSEELPNTLPEDQITWIRHSGTTSPEALQRIGERYGVHSLALEDIANVGQRPKMVNYGDAIFVTMVVPRLHNNAILTAQLSLYMKDKLVLSFFEGGEDFFRSILDRLAQDKGRLRGAGPDYLVYRLVDLAVDLIYPILQQSAEELEELELRPLDVDQDDSLNTLYTIRRQLAVLGRYVGPQQELVQNLIDEEAHLIGGECSVFLGDTLDHLQ